MDNPKIKTVDKITESMLNQELFGVKYVIDSDGVKINSFIPSIVQNDESMDNNQFRVSSDDLKTFQVSLYSSFFLPLRTSLNGLYEKCLYYFSDMLKKDEKMTIVWLFQKRRQWRDVAVDMYKSYLKGVDDPSDVKLIRGMEDKLYTLINKVSSPLQQREYSDDVEKKILDEGYLFQCNIEIISKRTGELASLIQDVYTQYDYYNRMRLEPIEQQFPYVLCADKLDFKHQILSKSEIISLMCQDTMNIEEGNEDLEIEGSFESGEVSETQQSESVDNTWKNRVKTLPIVESKKVDMTNTTTVTRLAEAMKRVGVINQARLYNETVEQGCRLIVVNADIPKDKNFSDIQKKTEDIQVALGAQSLGIEQGYKAGTIKFSIPHKHQYPIGLRELIETDEFYEYRKNHPLAFIAGVDEVDNPIYLSLVELVHILIAGKSGGGKSVFLNQLLTTLLITHTPDELQLLLIDPKEVELNQYEIFPHVQEVITNMSKAIKSFNELVKEMDNRYKLFRENKVKDVNGYNQKVKTKLPRIVCVVEEWADLFSVAGKDAEEVVMRLGQKARAAGIHLIIVTQRPSAKILSGDIKANIQNAFSFNLGSNINYKTVFGTGIPYSLLGKGDGVMKIEGNLKEFQRFQSPIITPDQVEESEMYDKLAETFKGYKSSEIKDVDNSEEETQLDKLKQLIATTKETRTAVLREKLGVKNEKITELMHQLVNEGWLIKHKNRSKGYELVVDDEKLSEWIQTDGGEI